MNINATLFVQAANFFIAYLLFRSIFLKPAYTEIQGEKHYLESLHQLIKKEETALHTKDQESRKQWEGLRAYFARYKPEIIDKWGLFRIGMPRITIQSLSEKEEHSLIASTSHELASRMREKI